jgi:hypothetical protein
MTLTHIIAKYILDNYKKVESVELHNGEISACFDKKGPFANASVTLARGKNTGKQYVASVNCRTEGGRSEHSAEITKEEYNDLYERLKPLVLEFTDASLGTPAPEASLPVIEIING